MPKELLTASVRPEIIEELKIMKRRSMINSISSYVDDVLWKSLFESVIIKRETRRKLSEFGDEKSVDQIINKFIEEGEHGKKSF